MGHRGAVLGTLIVAGFVLGQAAKEAAGHLSLDPWELPPDDRLSLAAMRAVEKKPFPTFDSRKDPDQVKSPAFSVGFAVLIILIVQLLVGISVHFSNGPKAKRIWTRPGQAAQALNPDSSGDAANLMKMIDADNDGIITEEELAAAINEGVFSEESRWQMQEEQEETTTLRVIKSFHQPQYIRTQMSLAAMFLGEGSRIEKVFFNIGAKDRIITGVLWGFWWLGCSISLLSLLDLLPENRKWAAVLMLPLPVVTVPVLSEDLVKKILQNFHFYVLLAGNFWIFYCALIIQNGELVWFFWLCAYPTILIAPLVDAYPPRFRTFFAKHFFIGITCITIVWLVVILDGQTIPIRKIESRFGVAYSNNFVSQTVTAAVGLMGFSFRYLCNAFFHPSTFAILEVPLLTLHEQFALKVERTTTGLKQHVLERRRSKVRIPLGIPEE